MAVVEPSGAFELRVDRDTDAESGRPLRLTVVADAGGASLMGFAEVPDVNRDLERDLGDIILAAAGGCEPSWLPTFGGAPGLNGGVRALAVYDDGSGAGQRLYVGGNFTANASGTTPLAGVACWNGTSWIALGSGVTGISSAAVNAMVVYDDGAGPALIVGGTFSMAGGAPASRVASWNGEAWTPLGSGVSGGLTSVNALAVIDDVAVPGPSLYAGGVFTTAGGLPAQSIARWDGSAWSALGQGCNGAVNAVAGFEFGGVTSVYATGEFSTAGGTAVNKIAKWDGSAWTALGSGLASSGFGSTPVGHCLAQFNGQLYVGGVFETAGGIGSDSIARWTGSGWLGVGGGAESYGGFGVRAMTVFNDGGGDDLYVTGGFSDAGGIFLVSGTARWSGTAWSGLDASGVHPAGHAIVPFDDGSGSGTRLYVGGGFNGIGTKGFNSIASWDGDGWLSQGEGTNALDGPVNATAVFDDGQGGGPSLYVGGLFGTAGGVAVSGIARWDGQSWSPVGQGVTNSIGGLPTIRTMRVLDDGNGPALYVGGTFGFAGGAPAVNVARWDGNVWSSIGSGVTLGEVRDLVMFKPPGAQSPSLYAIGTFVQFFPPQAFIYYPLAHWNGSAWSYLYPSLNLAWVARALVHDDGSGDAIYIGGSFTQFFNVAANNIVRWNGTTWSALGSGVTGGGVADMGLFDDGSGAGEALYVIGGFTHAGGMPAPRIARWGDGAWSALTPSFGSSYFTSIAPFDDGTGRGEQLHVAYVIALIEDEISRLARWDGNAWTVLPGTIEGEGLQLEVFDDGSDAGPSLYAGGYFHVSPAGDSSLARWASCNDGGLFGDLNGDGLVDGADLGVLLGAWGPCPAEEPCPADLDGDGVIAGGDLGLLLGAWGS